MLRRRDKGLVRDDHVVQPRALCGYFPQLGLQRADTPPRRQVMTAAITGGNRPSAASSHALTSSRVHEFNQRGSRDAFSGRIACIRARSFPRGARTTKLSGPSEAIRSADARRAPSRASPSTPRSNGTSTSRPRHREALAAARSAPRRAACHPTHRAHSLPTPKAIEAFVHEPIKCPAVGTIKCPRCPSEVRSLDMVRLLGRTRSEDRRPRRTWDFDSNIRRVLVSRATSRSWSRPAFSLQKLVH